MQEGRPKGGPPDHAIESRAGCYLTSDSILLNWAGLITNVPPNT